MDSYTTGQLISLWVILGFFTSLIGAWWIFWLFVGGCMRLYEQFQKRKEVTK